MAEVHTAWCCEQKPRIKTSSQFVIIEETINLNFLNMSDLIKIDGKCYRYRFSRWKTLPDGKRIYPTKASVFRWLEEVECND